LLAAQLELPRVVVFGRFRQPPRVAGPPGRRKHRAVHRGVVHGGVVCLPTFFAAGSSRPSGPRFAQGVNGDGFGGSGGARRIQKQLFVEARKIENTAWAGQLADTVSRGWVEEPGRHSFARGGGSRPSTADACPRKLELAPAQMQIIGSNSAAQEPKRNSSGKGQQDSDRR